MAKTIAQRRLGFILQKRTYSYASTQSGIPRSTMWYAQTGIRKLPKEYALPLRRFYQREAYHRLHDSGWSAINAKNLSWYSPESARLKESEMKLLVEKYTLGGLWQKAWKARREGKDFDWDAEYEDMKKKVIKGLQESKEDWQSFGEDVYF